MSRLLILVTTLLVATTPMAADETPQQTAERLARLIDAAESVPRQAPAHADRTATDSEESIKPTAAPVVSNRESAPSSARQRNSRARTNGSQSILERHRITPLPRMFVEQPAATETERPQERPVAPPRQPRVPAIDECSEPAPLHR